MYVTKEELLRENVVYHCDTEEKANELLTKAGSFGLRWDNEERYSKEYNLWNISKKDTCYSFSTGMHGSKNYYKPLGLNIIEYKLDSKVETNFDHYKDSLLSIARVRILAIEKTTKAPIGCHLIGCSDCLFDETECGDYETLIGWGLSIYTPQKDKFKPEYKETYYYVSEAGRVEEIFWMGDVFDYMCYNMRNCFETEEEITQEVIDRILKEMRGKYENED